MLSQSCCNLVVIVANEYFPFVYFAAISSVRQQADVNSLTNQVNPRQGNLIQAKARQGIAICVELNAQNSS